MVKSIIAPGFSADQMSNRFPSLRLASEHDLFAAAMTANPAIIDQSHRRACVH
jgi:hypothetical protein